MTTTVTNKEKVFDMTTTVDHCLMMKEPMKVANNTKEALLRIRSKESKSIEQRLNLSRS